MKWKSSSIAETNKPVRQRSRSGSKERKTGVQGLKWHPATGQILSPVKWNVDCNPQKTRRERRPAALGKPNRND